MSAILTGGLRVRFGDVRFTAESPWTCWRRRSPAAGWRARSSGVASPGGSRAALALRAICADRGLAHRHPLVLTTRQADGLCATYVGVIVVGYPEGAPPFRTSTNEFGNLFARWDAGWYVDHRRGRLQLLGQHARAQTNVAFFPAYPLAVRVTAALLGARWGSPEDPAGFVRVVHRAAPCPPAARGLAGVGVAAFTWALVYLFRLARDLTDSEEAAAARRRPDRHVSVLVLLRRGLHGRPVPAVRDGRGLPLPAARVGLGRPGRARCAGWRGPTAACSACRWG